METKIVDMDLDAIRTDGDTQPRAGIDATLVAEYAERMKAGDEFPPLDVVFDGTAYWLVDGFHRLAAAREVGIKKILVAPRKGTLEEARWSSFAANRSHGLRRTNADKAWAVQRALRAKPNLSDRQIAEHVGVSAPMVATYREKLGASVKVLQMKTRTVTRSNKVYKQKTANIGKKAKKAAPPPSVPAAEPEHGESDEAEFESEVVPPSIPTKAGEPMRMATSFRSAYEHFANKIREARRENFALTSREAILDCLDKLTKALQS